MILIFPPLIFEGFIVIGIFPLLVEIFAPIFSRGSLTLSIGLNLNDLSPSKTDLKFCPDNSPVKSLAVVPEFPQSIVSGDSKYSLIPVPLVKILPLFSANITPIDPTAYIVLLTSSDNSRLVILVMSLLNVDKITALCEIDLSPGTFNSPEKIYLDFSIKYSDILQPQLDIITT